jgi:hypothetical protein
MLTEIINIENIDRQLFYKIVHRVIGLNNAKQFQNYPHPSYRSIATSPHKNQQTHLKSKTSRAFQTRHTICIIVP